MGIDFTFNSSVMYKMTGHCQVHTKAIRASVPIICDKCQNTAQAWDVGTVLV